MPHLGIISRVLIEVGHENGLRVRRLDVLARAAIAVAAGADFVVEGAVDLVLLRAEDGGEIVGHGQVYAKSFAIGATSSIRGCRKD